MTLPDERYRSLVQTEQFLSDLLDTQETPRVPKYIRQRAWSLLKHWPNAYHLGKLPEALPRDFARSIDPLVRLVLEHKEEQSE